MIVFADRRIAASVFRLLRGVAVGLCFAAGVTGTASAQGLDCNRLQQQIASGRGGSGQRINAELSRTVAAARQSGCDRQQFLFFGGGPPPQCGGLNARIAQLQASLNQAQGGREDLIARFNAYCRGGAQSATLQPPRSRGFFESLFGGVEDPRQVPPADLPQGLPAEADDGGDGLDARGGSQAVCVRACDGGFFPMNMSARRNGETLSELCTALCPNTQASVFTRNPNSEIRTALGLDGKPYMDLPNALKFQKSFDSACTCRPADKTWAQALAGAESVMGNQRKGDIVVTPAKSAELSRPKLDGKTRASLLNAVPPPGAAPVAALPGAKPAADEGSDVTGPDGVTRRVRTVGPRL